jgi:hypothetical protein
MRRVVTLIVLALVIGAAPGQAGAAPPAISPGVPFEVQFGFEDACGDFGLIASVRGKTHLITFSDGSGISGGQFFITWARDDDPSVSRTFAITGPTFYDATGAIDHGTGAWTVPLLDRSWVMVHGHILLSDAVVDGFQALASYHGHSVSVCDLLA